MMLIGRVSMDSGKFNSNFDVALMEAAFGPKDTRIVYLDKDFKPIYKTSKMKYSGAVVPSPPIVENNNLYFAPAGNPHEYEGHQIVKVNLKDGSKIEYDTGNSVKGPSGFSVCENDAYLCTNLNGKSLIYKRNLLNQKISIRNFDDLKESSIMKLFATKKRLFAWGIGDEDGKNSLYVFDAKTLKTIYRVKFIQSGAHFLPDNGKVYIILEQDTADGVPDSYFMTYNLKNNKYDSKKINIPEAEGVSLKKYKDLLVFPMHETWNKNTKSNGLLFYNPKNNKPKFVKFDDYIEQCEIRGK